MILRHLQQPDGTTCMATCLAMILDMDLDQCIALYHDKLYSQDFWFDDILDEHNIPYTYGHPARRRLHEGYVYLATVPSLNNIGGNHQVVIDYRDDEYMVLDPNIGRHGVLEYAQDGHNLFGWHIDLIIPADLYEDL